MNDQRTFTVQDESGNNVEYYGFDKSLGIMSEHVVIVTVDGEPEIYSIDRPEKRFLIDLHKYLCTREGIVRVIGIYSQNEK